MRRIADFIVRGRLYLFLFVAALTIGSVFLIPKVVLNDDMTEYLPDDSPMKNGLALMNDEFSEIGTDSSTGSFRMMFSGLDSTETMQIYEQLLGMDHVTNVAYDAASTDYQKDGYSLFVITLDEPADSAIARDSYNSIVGTMKDTYDIETDGDIVKANAEDLPLWIILLAVGLLILILFILSDSFVEPILFIIAIAMAILMNMGTNAFLSSVSTMTNSITAILQLALSVDYSIMLMNRYRQEKKKEESRILAMKNALQHSIGAILGSSVTTIVGLLVLVLMSFKIGEDMGIVLAKGVAFSLFSIFTVLPFLIVTFDHLIEKTKKKVYLPSLKHLAGFGVKGRWVITIAFLCLFCLMFWYRGSTDISYILDQNDKIAEIFPAENTIVLMYDKADEDAAAGIISSLESEGAVSSVSGYANTVGKKLDAAAMAESMSMDATTVQWLYYHMTADQTQLAQAKLPLSSLLPFMQEMMQNPLAAAFITQDMMQQFASLQSMGDQAAAILAQEMTYAEFAAMAGMDDEMAKLMYEMYFSAAAAQSGQEAVTMSVYDFVSNLMTEVSEGSFVASLFDETTVSQLGDAFETMKEGAEQLVGDTYGRVIIVTKLPEASEKTMTFISDLQKLGEDSLSKDFYLIGNSPMAYEMSQSFKSELNRITIITAAAIFLVVAVTFRSILIPFILVLVIQCSVFIMMGIINIQGYSIYFIALLVVQCILMGATIDYGILFTSYYREHRRTKEKREALWVSYQESLPTIMTSGAIMIIVTGVLGNAFSNPAISQICESISKGALCATLLIIFLLPGMLAAFDRWIIEKKK